MKKSKWVLTSVAIAVSLAGCSVFEKTSKFDNQVDDEYAHGSAITQSLQRREASNVKIHDRPWVSKTSMKLSRNRLPTNRNCDIAFATGSPMSLNEFSKMVNKLCGVAVRITADAEQKINGNLNANNSNLPITVSNNGQHSLIDIRWNGKLEGLFDTVASSLGLSWRYRNDEINLYYLDSRTFNVFAIPSRTEMKSVVQSGIDAGISGSTQGENSSSSGNSDGQSSQTTSVSLESNMTEDIRNSIQSMLTPNVGRLSASTSTGTVTVTDTPEVLDRIQQYVDKENKAITKQVLLNVKVLSVALDDSDQFDIDWNVIYSSGRIGASLVSSTASGGGNSLSANILDGNFKDSKFLMDALSKQGKVSVVTSPSVTTLNLQPVPVQVATQTSYLARVESTNTANVGSSVTLTPGTVTSGFNMNLLPFIMPENKLLLQYAINLSELKSIKEVKSSDADDGNKIQVPEIDNRIFSQKVKLSSGQTLILSGFEQTSTTAERTGTGNAFNWLFGGGVKAEKKRSVIVIMISPVIME